MTLIEYLLSEEDPLTMGISAVSLVLNPANKSHAVMMSGSNDSFFKATDAEERIVKGLFVRAGMPFKQKLGGGKLSKIEASTIKKMRDRFHATGADKNVTINHEREDGTPVYQDGCNVVESYIVSNDFDVKSLEKQGILDANIGDWVVGVKVTQEIWDNDVKNGEIEGLSLEGNLPARTVAASSFDVAMAKAQALRDELFSNI